MSSWSTDRPQPREFAAIPLVRVPPSGTIAGCITSREILSRDTHFANHRTQPCEEKDCPHCLAGYPARPHAYLSFISRANDRQYVLELTGLAANTVHDAMKRYGRLRGLLFNAYRKQKRPNGRVEIELAPDPAGEERLPPPVEIRRFMAMLWNLPSREAAVAHHAGDLERLPIVRPAPEPLQPADIVPFERGGNGRPS